MIVSYNIINQNKNNSSILFCEPVYSNYICNITVKSKNESCIHNWKWI